MRRSKSVRPQVEGLETLVFLSAGVNPAAARAALGRPRPAESARPTADVTTPDLSGTMRGSYKLLLAADGSSGTFQIQGTGSIRGLGPARVAASYAADQSSSPETMTVTLAARQGILTLQVGRVAGDVDPDESTARLRYRIVSGTGSFAKATGTGLFDMTLRPQTRSLGANGQLSVTLRADAA